MAQQFTPNVLIDFGVLPWPGTENLQKHFLNSSIEIFGNKERTECTQTIDSENILRLKQMFRQKSASKAAQVEETILLCLMLI